MVIVVALHNSYSYAEGGESKKEIEAPGTQIEKLLYETKNRIVQAEKSYQDVGEEDNLFGAAKSVLSYEEQLQGLAEMGNPDAQYVLGMAYEWMALENLIKAGRMLEQASSTENASYIRAYAELLGSFGPGSKEKAAELYHKAAELGDVRSMRALGYHYGSSDQQMDSVIEGKLPPKESLDWFTKAANKGDTDSQSHLCSAYLHPLTLGRIFETIDEEAQVTYAEAARHWCEKAAESGEYHLAFSRLANLYDKYLPVRDPVEAYKWHLLVREYEPESHWTELDEEKLRTLKDKLTPSQRYQAEIKAIKWKEEQELPK